MSVSLVTRNGHRNSFHGPMNVSSRAGEQGGSHQRQGDRPQDPELPAPSSAAAENRSSGSCRKNCRNTNTAVELIANGRIIPSVGVGQPVGAHDHHVDRDDQQLERHDLHEQHHREQRAAAPEVQPGQGVAGEHPEHDRAEQHAAGEDARVEQRLRPGRRGSLICAVVVGGSGRRSGSAPVQRGVRLLLQRADHHVVEGEQEHDGAQEQSGQAGLPAQGACRAAEAAAVASSGLRRRLGSQVGHVSHAPGACG